jgi:hypothetical protein
VVALVGAVLLSALAAAPASAINPADEAATHAYLQAEYEHALSVLSTVDAEGASVKGFVGQVGGECAGVLKGAPTEEGPPSASGPPTPRARGEQQRSQHQLRTVEEELAAAFLGALERPDLPALRAFVAQTSHLTWSDPRIAPAIDARATRLISRIEGAPTSLCADLGSWAASGFRKLSQATRSFEATRAAADREAAGEISVARLLRPTEGPPEAALRKRIAQIGERYGKEILEYYREGERLDHTLGRPENPLERREHEPVIAHGVTATGLHYKLRVSVPEEDSFARCHPVISLDLEKHAKSKRGTFSSGSESTVCLDKRDLHGSPSADGGCGGEGMTIYTGVPNSVRTVELRLRDGRTFTSGVVHVPRRYGGPAGVYIRSLPAHSAQPLSLTERDAAGRIVAVRHFGRSLRCPPPGTGAPGPPKFFTLANAQTPEGEPFSISGTLVHFGGHFEFSVNVTTPPGSNSSEEGTIEIGQGRQESKAYEWSKSTECAPRPYAIVYGTLTPPAAAVLARTPAGLVPLTVVPLGAELHAPGPLAYGVFTELPSELVVERSDGSTLYAESLVKKDAEQAEFCAGYAEP